MIRLARMGLAAGMVLLTSLVGAAGNASGVAIAPLPIWEEKCVDLAGGGGDANTPYLNWKSGLPRPDMVVLEGTTLQVPLFPQTWYGPLSPDALTPGPQEASFPYSHYWTTVAVWDQGQVCIPSSEEIAACNFDPLGDVLAELDRCT